MSHVRLPFDSFLPPRHHAHSANARAVLLGMKICTWWWVRHCLKCQARKTLRLTVSWPIILMPLPEGPGIAISVDSFGPLPVTPRGKFYILLSPIVSAAEPTCWAVTAAKFTAEGTANIIINLYTPLRGCPRSIRSDNGLQLCSKLSHAMLEASWCSEYCHQLLLPQRQSWGGACEPHDARNAGNGRQRAPN